ncbi:MAG TPA: alpha-amylase, partial [Lachnoclostridium sp.]|nr:alpha-amylase [Lachnoclostridium sp.]
MGQYKIAKHEMGTDSMGLSKVSGGIRLCVAAEGEECRVLIFKAGEETPVHTLSFPAESRKGDVWSMTILGEDFENLEYCFEIDGKLFSDPYGKRFTGREVWGDLEHASSLLRTPIEFADFDWEEDKLPQVPYED